MYNWVTLCCIPETQYCKWTMLQLKNTINHIDQLYIKFSSVQSLSCVRLFLTPWTTARQASLSITNSRSPPKPMSIESVMPFNHLSLCRPLLLPPLIPPSMRVFSNESVLHMRWPKYWSFSFTTSPSNEHPGLISFRMDCLDLLAAQGTLKSLLQHHSSKASILWHSAFFISTVINNLHEIISHNHHNHITCVLVPFYRGGNWDLRLSNVSKITKLITGEAGIWIQGMCHWDWLQ